jgi:hypothetical protein
MNYTAFRIARRLNCVTRGGLRWVVLNLANFDRQRVDPRILSDWQCDRCDDREREFLVTPS